MKSRYDPCDPPSQPCFRCAYFFACDIHLCAAIRCCSTKFLNSQHTRLLLSCNVADVSRLLLSSPAAPPSHGCSALALSTRSLTSSRRAPSKRIYSTSLVCHGSLSSFVSRCVCRVCLMSWDDLLRHISSASVSRVGWRSIRHPSFAAQGVGFRGCSTGVLKLPLRECVQRACHPHFPGLVVTLPSACHAMGYGIPAATPASIYGTALTMLLGYCR